MLFAEAFVTMLVILDPVGNVPVFLALTKDDDAGRRRRASLEATAVAASVILVFAAFGQQILQLLGISLQALQVAGGLVLVLVALELLGSTQRTGHSADVRNPALVPLGTPLLAGPGAIAATMVYIRRADDFGEAMLVVSAIMAALAVVYVALRSAAGLARILGRAGIELLTRVVGVLLAAIAVQLVAAGIDAWVRHGV
ncbi:MAG TPA: MarC family protein [Acidimicrobiales bacterium]|nr:MarC family protein [Acidimicrobiales bacterium]